MFCISRFKGIEKREFECDVVTPLFLGGADPKKAELRVPPIKAAMRFWWRAQCDGEDLLQMAKKEAAIFGSIERKAANGKAVLMGKKAAISVELDCQEIKPVLKDMPPGKQVDVEGKKYKTSIINYLSYGLFEYKSDLKKNVYNKEHIEPGAKFKLHISYPQEFEADITKSLKALISFGGLGARSRNGFGSLHCQALTDRTLKQEGELKAYTSFSKEAKLFDKFGKHNKWVDALSEIGEVYRKAKLNLEKRHSWEKRKFIAMPIEAKNENIPALIRHGRHAKPYFLHVNKTPDGYYQGQILFLPYQYMAKPDDKPNQVNEYMEVCRKMNEGINIYGGAK